MIVQITNPTPNPISVLAWNNMFDNVTALPVFFDVKDDRGNVVPLASMNVMRAGFSENDMYTLAPRSTYYRTVDLRQVMQNVPSGPSKPVGATLDQKVFTIAPPRSFKGFIGDASKAVEAPPHWSTEPKSFTDLAVSNLQDITVDSTRSKFSAVLPLIGDIDSSFVSAADGAHVDSQCAANNLTDLSTALSDAGYYANSLGLAANDSTSTLFPLFFPNTNSARYEVNSIAVAVANSISGKGPHVDVYCNDIQDLCKDPNFLGYSFTPSFIGNAYIVLCPAARALGRAPNPCQSGTIVGATATHVMFHLMTTLNNVVPNVMINSVYGPTACQQLANSTSVDPTTNPDSFAQLALAQWGDGLGGAPYNGQSCVPDTAGTINTRRRMTQFARSKALGAVEPITSLSKRQFPQRVLNYQDVKFDIAITQECTAAESSMLHFAVQNARALAEFAITDMKTSSPDSELRWATYEDSYFHQFRRLIVASFFHGDAAVKKYVNKLYDSVSKW